MKGLCLNVMHGMKMFCVLTLIVAVFSGCDDVTREGWDALISGDYKEAITGFKSCVDSEGDTGESASWCSFMLGKAYFENQQYPEAIAYFKRAIDVYKKGMYVFHLDYAWRFWLGRAYFENKQYKEAIVNFDKAASIAPENPETMIPSDYTAMRKYYLPLIPRKSSCYIWLGNAYYQDAQYQEAVGAYKKSIELDPSETYAYENIAAAYRGLKQYDDALTAAKRSIEVKPTGFAYSTLATIYTDKKQYIDAIAAYKKAIELAPKNISHYFSLSNLYSAKEDYAGAIAVNQKAQALAPENAYIPYAIASFYMYMGKYDEAIGSLNKSISLRTVTGVGLEIAVEENDPVVKNVKEGPAKRAGVQAGDRIIRINGQSTDGWDINKVVQHLKGTEGTQVALTVKRKSLDKPVEKTVTRETIISKEAAAPLAFRSFAHKEKGNLEAFYQDARKAYAIDPDDGWAKRAMCVSWMEQGKYQDALNILSRIKDSPFDRMLEATAHAKNGDMEKAAAVAALIPEDYLSSRRAHHQSYRKALFESLKPHLLAKKNAAKLLELKGDAREALREYSDILKIADDKGKTEIRNHIGGLMKKNPSLAELPEEARKYVMRGEALIKDGKFDDAVKEFNTAMKLAPWNPQIYFNTALVYVELKEYAKAINFMNIYLDLYPDAPNSRQVKDEIYKLEVRVEKGVK